MEGAAEAKMIEVGGQGYANYKMAEQMSKVADKNAEVTKIEGTAEAELSKVLASRRLYEFLNKKLNVIKSLALNSQLKIFGKQADGNAMSQLGAYGLMKSNALAQ